MDAVGQKPVMNMANDDMVALKAQGLSKRLGGVQLFAGATFEVSGGQALVVRGTNGSGKTTLLRILAGLLEGDEGEVVVHHGSDVLDQADAAEQIHYFGHSNALKTAQTVRANLTFWRDFLSGEVAIEAVAEQLDIAHLLDLP
ncbi:MAG: ATP-binding cassette domain-containing protein, partial [Pseudomonadota bacterium]